MSMLSRPTRCHILGLVCAATLCVPPSEAGPRNEIKVAPYRATTDEARRTALEGFHGILFKALTNRAASLYFELLGDNISDQHIVHLSDIRDDPITDDIRTFADARRHIESYGSMAIVSGTVNEVGEDFEFRSNIYVDTATEAIPLPVRLFPVVYRENAGTAHEMEAAHFFTFFYALTVDAAQHDLPVRVIQKLQAATQHAFNDMAPEQQAQNQSAMDEIAGIR